MNSFVDIILQLCYNCTAIKFAEPRFFRNQIILLNLF